MTPIMRISFRGRVRSPTTLFRGDFGLATTSEAQDADDGRRHGQYEEQAAEEFHRPIFVGLTRIELVTSSLSGMRSNQLSYSPLSGLSS